MKFYIAYLKVFFHCLKGVLKYEPHCITVFKGVNSKGEYYKIVCCSYCLVKVDGEEMEYKDDK